MRVTLTQGDDVAAIVRDAVRGSSICSLVVVMPPLGDALADAVARASIAPLAIECAPDVRINAVVAHGAATVADIEAAVLFLDDARSTTGQIIEIG